MEDFPFDVIKNQISYIEIDETSFIDYTTLQLFFGFNKPYDFFIKAKEKKGAFIYDINRYLEDSRVVPNKYFDCPFIGASSIKSGKEFYMERMLRRSDVAFLLKYPPRLLNIITGDVCPYYVFDSSSIKYYRRSEIHFSVYRISNTITGMSDSEDLRTQLATEAWFKKISKIR